MHTYIHTFIIVYFNKCMYVCVWQGPLNNLQVSMISLPRPKISTTDKRLTFTALGSYIIVCMYVCMYEYNVRARLIGTFFLY